MTPRSPEVRHNLSVEMDVQVRRALRAHLVLVATHLHVMCQLILDGISDAE